jgi:hypothetical protein
MPNLVIRAKACCYTILFSEAAQSTWSLKLYIRSSSMSRPFWCKGCLLIGDGGCFGGGGGTAAFIVRSRLKFGQPIACSFQWICFIYFLLLDRNYFLRVFKLLDLRLSLFLVLLGFLCSCCANHCAYSCCCCFSSCILVKRYSIMEARSYTKQEGVTSSWYLVGCRDKAQLPKVSWEPWPKWALVVP